MNLLPRARAAAVAALSVLAVALPAAASIIALPAPVNASTSCATETQDVATARQTVIDKKDSFVTAKADLADARNAWYADRTPDNKANLLKAHDDARDARGVVKDAKDALETARVYYRGCATPSVISGVSANDRDSRDRSNLVQVRVTNLTPGQVVTVFNAINYVDGGVSQNTSFELTAGADGIAEGSRPIYAPFGSGSCSAVDGYTLSIYLNKGHFEGYVPSVC